MEQQVLYLPEYMIAIKYLEGGEVTLSEWARDSRITYSYLCLIKKVLEQKGLVYVRKKDGDRKVYIILSDMGRELLTIVNFLLEKLTLNKNIEEMRLLKKVGRTEDIKNENSEVEENDINIKN